MATAGTNIQLEHGLFLNRWLDWAPAKDRLEQLTTGSFILELLVEAEERIPPSNPLPSEGIQQNGKWR